jgi:uncharacterized protein YndB with AHSA1/START domain
MTDGTLEQVGDRWRLRFRRPLAHPPERVWQAITSSEDLAAWFPQEVSGDWQAGSRVTFSDPNRPAGSFTGEVLRCEPPRVLEFTWGPDVLRFEIEPSATGCTLTLVDTFVEQGKAARDAAGWHVCLDALVAALDDVGLDGSSQDRWPAVHPGYVAAFGPAGSSIGPPPSSAS